MSEYLSGFMSKVRNAITSETDLVLAIVGAGSSAAIAEVVKSWFPEQTSTVADETIVAVVGFILFYFGDKIHRLLRPFGFGMFLAAVGAWSSQFVASIILMLKKQA